jgi:polyisoprenoid-binding protein YceI
MRKKIMVRVLSAAIVTFFLAGSACVAEDRFTLTGDNTKITFVGTKPQGKHEGGFKKLTGTATIDGNDATTLKISIEIDMNSTFTDNGMLTNHLKSPDFFGVKNNPKSKFATTKVEKGDAGYTVTGKLTLNGKTKDVTFPAKIEVADGKLTLSSDFKINRNDWGISYGRGMVDDDVALKVSLTAAK